jgi:hypothetical protein
VILPPLVFLALTHPAFAARLLELPQLPIVLTCSGEGSVKAKLAAEDKAEGGDANLDPLL